MENKIIELTINLPMATETYEVGRSYHSSNADEICTEIKDASIEWETHIDFIYDIYVNGKLYKSIVNTPVTLTYSLEVDSE